MNLAERILEMGDIEFSDELITTIEVCDIEEYKPTEKKKQGQVLHANFVFGNILRVCTCIIQRVDK